MTISEPDVPEFWPGFIDFVILILGLFWAGRVIYEISPEWLKNIFDLVFPPLLW